MKTSALLLAISFLISIPLSAEEPVWKNPVRNIQENPLLNSIASSLSAHKTLRSSFTQTRTMSFMKKPLIMTGDFVYSRQHGLYWKLLKPYEAGYVITPDAMYSYDDKGNRVDGKGAGEQVFHRVASMFSAIFTGDIRELEKLFDIYFSGTGKEWRLGLRPKRRLMQKIVDHILVDGNQYVESITVFEKSGDTLRLEFPDMSNAGEALNQTELSHFAEH